MQEVLIGCQKICI